MKWYEHPCPLGELPDDVAARLNAQGEVLDMSQHLQTLIALAERRGYLVDVREAIEQLPPVMVAPMLEPQPEPAPAEREVDLFGEAVL